MPRLGRIGTLTVLGFVLSTGVLKADEEKIPLDKVPKAVLSAFKAKFPKATIQAAIKEEEDGKTVYEIESTAEGLGIDAVLKPDGEFVEIEKEIKPADLPSTVSGVIKAKHPKATVKKAEIVTIGKKVTYEVILEEDGKTTEHAFDKNGESSK